jgi:hypothetical protein
VGVQGVLGELDQSVEHAGAVVAGIGLHLAARGVGVDSGSGPGQGQQGRSEHGAVLGAPASVDPHAAGAVVGDREEAAGVCCPLLPLERGLVAALGAVGVDDVREVSGGAGQVGGVEPLGLLQEHQLAAGPQGRARGKGVHGVADDPGLRSRDLPAAQRLEGGGLLGHQLPCVHDGASPLAAGQAGQVGEPVGRGAPVQLLAGQVAGVDLRQQLRLQGGQLSLQLLDRRHTLDQLGVGEPGDEPVSEHPHPCPHVGQHDCW